MWSTVWSGYTRDAGEARSWPSLPPGCWPAPSVVPAMMIMISTWRRHWPDRARTWRSTSTRFAPWLGRLLFCSGMNVPDAPYVLQLPNVLHLATDITAADKGVASALPRHSIRPLRCAGTHRQRAIADRGAGAPGS